MASKRRQRRKTCTGKCRYATLAEAQAARWRSSHYRGQAGLNVYRCRYCGGYHLGHRAGLTRALFG